MYTYGDDKEAIIDRNYILLQCEGEKIGCKSVQRSSGTLYLVARDTSNVYIDFTPMPAIISPYTV